MDLAAAVALIRAKNPSARLLLTVSPVPLIATMEDRSVLVSTTYSKSVLRVAAEEIAAQDMLVAYFPSYEIIAGNFTRGGYFAPDLRSVTEEGIAHVMRLFMQHYADHAQATAGAIPAEDAADRAAEEHAAAMRQVVKVICDEEALGPS